MISSILNSLKNKNSGAEKAKAIVNVVKITIHKFFIFNRLDSEIIQTNTADEPIKRSLPRDWDAGLILASCINSWISKEEPYIFTNSIFDNVGKIAPNIAKSK